MPTDPLKPLLIKDGVGDYHVNRFRIYFQPTRTVALDALVHEFIENFDVIFNGTKLEKNVAHVVRPELKYQGNMTLKFTMDMRIAFGFVDFFDLHSDWVGQVWTSKTQGFAVQTLRYDDGIFDFAMKSSQGLAFGGRGVPGIGIAAGAVLGLYAYDTNNNHFLAGRRSWILGQATDLPPPAGATAKSAKAEVSKTHSLQARLPTYFLETAAIERFSGGLYALANLDPGIFLSMEDTIKDVWSTLLSNYVRWKKFHVLKNAPNSSIWPTKPEVLRDVKFVLKSFDDKDECLKQQWVKDLMTLHPGLKDQFNK